MIPDRVARRPTGVPFAPASAASRHPERLAHITRHLNWLSPLNALSVDDQRVLGLVNAAGRPVHSGDLDEGAGDGDPEDAPAGEPVEHAVA